MLAEIDRCGDFAPAQIDGRDGIFEKILRLFPAEGAGGASVISATAIRPSVREPLYEPENWFVRTSHCRPLGVGRI